MANTITVISGATPGTYSSGATIPGVSSPTPIGVTFFTDGFTGSAVWHITTPLIPGSPSSGTVPSTDFTSFTNPTTTFFIPTTSLVGTAPLTVDSLFVTGGPFTSSYTLSTGVVPPPSPSVFDFDLVVPPAVPVGTTVTADVSTSPTAAGENFIITRRFDPGDGSEPIFYLGARGETDSAGEALVEFSSVNSGTVTYTVTGDTSNSGGSPDTAESLIIEPKVTINGTLLEGGHPYNASTTTIVTTLDQEEIDGASIDISLFLGVIQSDLDATATASLINNQGTIWTDGIAFTDGQFSGTISPLLIDPCCGLVKLNLTFTSTIEGSFTQYFSLKPETSTLIEPATFVESDEPGLSGPFISISKLSDNL